MNNGILQCWLKTRNDVYQQTTLSYFCNRFFSLLNYTNTNKPKTFTFCNTKLNHSAYGFKEAN